MGPRAAVIIVGDEILGGHTQDTNSHWIAQRLRGAGVALARIETIPDEVEDIESTLRRLLLLEFNWIFVVGGIGPTPDDRTYEGVAKALGVPLVVDPEQAENMRRRVAASPYAGTAWSDPEKSEAMRRMIAIPSGAQALANPEGAALGCVASAGTVRVVVFPGVPKEMYAMFEKSFAPVLLEGTDSPDAVAEIEVFGAEASYWDALTELGRAFPQVKVGSYPQDEEGRIILRLTGPPGLVESARERLLALIKT